ncbi:MAG: hypothetical protein BGO49_22100 [Planctomycetales bacterium 71-10]|nr:MAG: hypothetical protein BGO49_22100 [Planctomycetales bacterium 71-10]
MREARPRTVFISYGRTSTDAILKARLKESGRSRFAQLLTIDPPRMESVPSLLGFFDMVLGLGPAYRWLPAQELVTVLSSGHAPDRFIGGAVDPGAKTVTLVRGDRETMVFPFSFFDSSDGSPRPDFARLSFADHGRTVAFGDYEAAADGILYESDVEYRRRQRESMRESERGFGPSLRRLRLQKKLGREDFAPISAEAVARIERGEVSPSKPTLGRIAKRLGVAPEDIETY